MPAIVLENHRPEWANIFRQMKSTCENIFGPVLTTIDHFGSTSIPGIAAKPIIDMIGLVASLPDLDNIIKSGLPANVTCRGENAVPGRRYFVLNQNGKPEGHLHLFEPGNRDYEDRIIFRDFLQRNFETAKLYEQLKMRLCSKHADDPVAYWQGKQAFVKTIVVQAKTEIFGSNTNNDMRKKLSSLELHLETDRLILEPIGENHAADMVMLLSDPHLHIFVPSDPPTLEKLRSQYKSWESRLSPQEDELWLNWVARLKVNGQLAGHFQTGVKKSLEANIAYTVGTEFQLRGLAYEGIHKILNFLFNQAEAKLIKAWVDTRNVASINLVKKLGMTQIGFIAKADHFKGMDSDEYVYGLTR